MVTPDPYRGRMPEGTGRSPAIVVSACLVGVPCNHVGAASPSPAVLALSSAARLVPICPEVAGGLPVPREAAERVGERVVTRSGADVTACYERGAAAAVALAAAVGASEAVLKARSPSCGCREVYDGTFSRSLVPGEGVAAAALRAAGVRVRSDEDVAAGRPAD